MFGGGGVVGVGVGTLGVVAVGRRHDAGGEGGPVNI